MHFEKGNLMTENEFYEKIPEWIEHDKSRWNHITLLAYFCHKYEQKNGVRFRLVRCQKGPTMGKEASDFAKLFKLLAPENYDDLTKEKKQEIKSNINKKIYNYINWMFDYKFRSGQVSVTGTKLFHTPSIIVQFEKMYDTYIEKNEKRLGIQELLLWVNENLPEILDNHQLDRIEDLEMIKKYIEIYSLSELSSEVRLVKKANELMLF